MPKERRVSSSLVDQAMVSPYSLSLKISDCGNHDSSSPKIGDEKEWEEARCPICMEHPHNAVLLLCSSHDKGCRPFICDTSYRHSNCLDQFRKSAEQESELLCPLCRGAITGWELVHPARKYMDSQIRTCSLETCSFSGNYVALRKHARLEHPSKRPSEASPTRQSNWAAMERQRDIEDALAYHSEFDYDWTEESFLSSESFFDFQSGMSDIEDSMIDEMFLGISLSFFSMYSTSSEELMDSGTSRSLERQLATIPLPNNPVGNIPTNLHSENRANPSSSAFQREDDVINRQPRTSSPRRRYYRENASAHTRRTSNHNHLNNANISRTRPSNQRENPPPVRSQARPNYYNRDRDQPSSRSRSSYYNREHADSSTARQTATRHLPSSSRQQHLRHVPPAVRQSDTRQSYSRNHQSSTRRMPYSYNRRPYSRYYRSPSPNRQLHSSSRQTRYYD
ncbi:uncharacterized protein LOC127243393 [Andrographis paniculata]|uniref:uncharacterized protein LOC127243393 n=1 Tax=Andrographis paniculata TaxID=175694 RepID=UPI0021E83EBA|nr:uncharacterized protein LOC127243393 [Andrographis paniculata]